MTTLIESQHNRESLENANVLIANDTIDVRKTRAISVTSLASSVGVIDVTMSGGQRVTISLATNRLHRLSIIKLWVAGTIADGVIGYY